MISFFCTSQHLYTELVIKTNDEPLLLLQQTAWFQGMQLVLVITMSKYTRTMKYSTSNIPSMITFFCTSRSCT